MKMGKKCDLCDGVARMYCESDQASLCWSCDAKVHGANFLVAKHTRCLLCSACQSLTPWKATGLRLGPTFSVCDSCVALKSAAAAGGGVGGVVSDRSQEINEDRVRLRHRDEEGDSAESYDDGEDEDEDEEYSDEEEEEEEEEDDVDDEEAENQVVPWAAPLMSSSSSNGGGGDLAAKRTRESSDEEMGCSSGQESNFSRPLKRPSGDEAVFTLEGERTLSAAVDSSSLIFAISKTRTNLSR